MKVQVRAVEEFTTIDYREKIELDTDNYPELEGMSEDEVTEYISNNCWEMKPTDDSLYESLGEELLDKDIEYNHIGGESTDFEVEF